jgi:hypothetical protein
MATQYGAPSKAHGTRELLKHSHAKQVPISREQIAHGINEGKLPLISRSTKTSWVGSRHGGGASEKTTTSVYVTAAGAIMAVQDHTLRGKTWQTMSYPVAKLHTPPQRSPDLTGFAPDYLKGWLNTPAGVGELPMGSGGGMLRPY